MTSAIERWFLRGAIATALLIAVRAEGAVTINGLVVSDQGQPVPQTLVTITPSPASGIVSGPIVYRTVTDQTGAFTVNISDPGNYAVCAGSLDAALLDSCLWLNSGATLSVSSSGSSQFKLTLQSGTRLRFRVNDPSHLLTRPGAPPPQNPQNSTFLGVGVWTNDGHYHHAQILSYDSNGFDYALIIPIGANLLISFQSANISVLDSTGAPVGPSSPGLSFQSQANESATVRTFSVAPPPSN
jgi:hypothetical protein